MWVKGKGAAAPLHGQGGCSRGRRGSMRTAAGREWTMAARSSGEGRIAAARGSGASGGPRLFRTAVVARREEVAAERRTKPRAAAEGREGRAAAARREWGERWPAAVSYGSGGARGGGRGGEEDEVARSGGCSGGGTAALKREAAAASLPPPSLCFFFVLLYGSILFLLPDIGTLFVVFGLRLWWLVVAGDCLAVRRGRTVDMGEEPWGRRFTWKPYC